MLSRRRFLTLSAVAGWLPAPALARPADVATTDVVNQRHNVAKNQPVTAQPFAIATWNQPGASQAAARVLSAGGRALDAVEAGVRVPEADPKDISVGYGGLPDRDGRVTLDACIMDERGNAGSVTFLEHIMHPVSVARAVMEKTPHVMLSGAGALQFALAQGFKKQNLLTPEAKASWQTWLKTAQYKPVVNIERHDTIGMLTIDAQGNMAGACTTSGMAYKLHGRVGDSPIIGAGLFVDNAVGGACATGVGEAVMKTCGSFLAVELMRQGRSPQQACEEVIRRISGQPGYRDIQVGVLAADKQGRYGAFSIQPGFNFTVFQNGQHNVVEAESLLKK